MSGKHQICLRDTVELDSYSIAKGSATHTWSIPGAATTTDLNQRQVQVTFMQVGTYVATLTISQDGKTDQKSVEIVVSDECGAEPIPGNAIHLPGASSDFATTARPLGITTNAFTISTWIKRDGDQASYAGIVFTRGASSAGLNFRSGNQLAFHWNNSQWGWNSGLVVPDGEWAHVAMAVSAQETRLYLNGIEAINTANPAPYAFDSVLNFGADPNWAARRFRGEMDEVAVYDRTLTASEIRESMHLTRDPSRNSGLIGYWQFNRNEGIVTDRVSTNHAFLQGSLTRVPSTAPTGGGESSKRVLLFPGTYNFGNTGLTVEFPSAGPLPLGEIYVTRIDQNPTFAPGNLQKYWIVRNFANPGSFAELTSLTFAVNVGFLTATQPSVTALYQRPANSSEAWGPPNDQGDASVAGTPGTVTFSSGNGTTAFGQFTLFLP